MSALDCGVGGWLGGLADQAEGFLQARLDRLVAATQRQTDRLADSTAERFAQHLVGELTQRLAARLLFAAVAAAVMVIGAGLLALGLAGALGEAFGRPWLGQLAAGAFALTAALVALAFARTRDRRRREPLQPEATPTARPVAQTAPTLAREHVAPNPNEEVFDAMSRQAVLSGTDLLRRHPLVSMAALSAAGMLAGTLLQRSNGRHSVG